MKRISFLIIFILGTITNYGQGRIRIAYIDMEYILENLPEYQTALKELDQKANKWKAEIEKRTQEIKDMKISLEQEKVLLTKELLQEKEEEIAFKEKSLLKYQLEKFGPEGDYILQKQNLVAPVQDRVFNAVTKLVQSSKYDIIFDKSNDKMGIIYTNPKMDISDKILKLIQKEKGIEKRKGDKKKRAKERKEKLSEAQKRRAELAAKRKEEREERRKKMLEERMKKREAAKNKNTKKSNQVKEKSKTEEIQKKKTEIEPENLEKKEEQQKATLSKKEENNKNQKLNKPKKLSKEELIAKRKKEREERRKRILEERRKKREQKNNQKNNQ